jgi:subtilisin family serine protease
VTARRLLLVSLLAALALPSAAVAAGGDADPFQSVIVRLRRPAPSFRIFAPDRAARAGAVEHLLRADLGRRGRGLRAAFTRARHRDGLETVRPLWIVGGYAITARRSEVDRLRARPDVAAVVADTADVVPAGANIDLVAAPPVWTHAGVGVLAGTRGAGVTVAIIDTGVDTGGQLAASFRGRATDWYDAVAPGATTTPYDDGGGASCRGHGTGVTGVAVGGTDDTGTPIGVAPAARWIAARIFDRTCAATTSTVHAALQWALDPDGNPATADTPDVINNSWTQETSTCDLTFQPDVDALRAANILPVFAAGNVTSANAAGSARSPANLPGALAVGSLDTAGTTVLTSSARGPSACAGHATFPDLVAPGQSIRTTDRFGLYQTLDGTSFAAPHVAGTLALLLARHPGLTAQQQADALTRDATVLGPAATFGAGRVNALAAFEDATLPGPVDRTAPLVSGAAATPGVSAGAGNVTVTAIASDDVPLARLVGTVAAVSATVDGAAAAVVPVDGAFDGATEAVTVTVAAAGLVAGTHTVALRATDDSGNLGPAGTATFVIDRSGPTVASLRATIADGPMLTVSATATSTSTVVTALEWYDGADPGPGHGSRLAAAGGAVTVAGRAVVDASSWTPGPHTIAVRGLDAGGNWGAVAERTVIVPRWRLADGFEHGAPRGWAARTGAASVSGAAAIAGTRGLGVPVRTRAFLRDATLAGARSLDVTFALDASHATVPGAVTVLAVRDRAGRTALVLDLRRARRGAGRLRLGLRTATCVRYSSWARLADGARTVHVRLDVRTGAASLRVTGRAPVTMRGGVRTTLRDVRLGSVTPLAAARGSLRIDSYSSLR